MAGSPQASGVEEGISDRSGLIFLSITCSSPIDTIVISGSEKRPCITADWGRFGIHSPAARMRAGR